MGCTVNDIARAAGVSRSTVLRALSGKPDVCVETRERIRSIAADMKYRPNYIARSLTRGKSNLVGVIATPSLYHSFKPIIERVEHGLREAGYSTLFYISSHDSGPEEIFIENLMKNRAEGVVAVPGSTAVTGAYRELVDSGTKLVILDGYIEGLPAPQILGDNYKAARLATDHLLKLGHRRIVYLGIPQVSHVGRERARGFREALADAGVAPSADSIVETEFDEFAAEKTAAEILARPDRPTGLLVRHDIVARGVMRAILAAGLSIPNDISVVGSGDVLGSDMFRIPLTTVHFPAQEMADLGVKTLLAMLAGQTVEPKVHVLDVRLVERASAAPPKIP